MTVSAIVFTKSSCPWCTRAKALLDQYNVPYTEYIIGSEHTKESIQKKVNDLGVQAVIRTVPQVFIIRDGVTTYVGGFTDLQAKQSILES